MFPGTSPMVPHKFPLEGFHVLIRFFSYDFSTIPSGVPVLFSINSRCKSSINFSYDYYWFIFYGILPFASPGVIPPGISYRIFSGVPPENTPEIYPGITLGIPFRVLLRICSGIRAVISLEITSRISLAIFCRVFS